MLFIRQIMYKISWPLSFINGMFIFRKHHISNLRTYTIFRRLDAVFRKMIVPYPFIVCKI